MYKKKLNKKPFFIFGIILVLFILIVAEMGGESKPSNDSTEISKYEGQEIDLLNLKQYPFGESLENVLREICVNDSLHAVCEVDNSYGMTLRITTSTKELWVSIDGYYNDDRRVMWIRDYNDVNHIYYYISNSLNYNEPIYSYQTGELLIDKIDGNSSAYPLILTVEQLVAEINNDLQSTANKYNGKWIQITGKVTYISTGPNMRGYYLYGEFGASGLKITCWVNDSEILASVGETKTFLGMMREVTIGNNTEIAYCTVVK